MCIVRPLSTDYQHGQSTEKCKFSVSCTVRGCGIVKGSAQKVYTYVCVSRGQSYGLATSTKLVCHIRTQQRRSTEKDEDINWVRTNLRTAKNHSAERGDTPRGSCTVIRS